MTINDEVEGGDVQTLDVAKTLVFCLHNITTGSFNERKQITRSLLQCIEDQGFQDAQLKGVAKILILTIPKYQDGKSKHVVIDFIGKLLEVRGVQAAKCLLVEMHNFSSALIKYPSSFMFPSTAMPLLSWCSKITEMYFSKKFEEVGILKALVEVEVMCYSLVCTYKQKRSRRIQNSALVALHLKKTPELLLQYIDMILKNEKLHVTSLCYIGFIFQYLTDNKCVNKITDQTKSSLIELFIKSCIQTKIKVNPSFIEFCAPFLKYITHEEFKDIVPTIEKSLLRNPETVLEAIGCTINSLSIDLSKYIDQLSTSICPHLASKNEQIRRDAVMCIRGIAKQCSDVGAVETLLKSILKVLNGSEGKLALPEQRHSVLEAIHGVTETMVTGHGHMESLANNVYSGLFPFILQEGHEDTLLYSLQVMTSWSKYFVSKLPSSFVENIKKGMSLKTSSAIVEGYFVLCADEAIKGDTVSQAADIIPVLMQTVEKSKQNVQLVNNVFLNIVASKLIIKMLLSHDIQGGSKMEGFWSAILDPVKKPLISEKFLASQNKNFFSHLAQFVNILFLHHADKVGEKQLGPWVHAINTMMVHGDFKTIKLVETTLTKMNESSKMKESQSFDIQTLRRNLIKNLHSIVQNESIKSKQQDLREDDIEKVFPLKCVIHSYYFYTKLGYVPTADGESNGAFDILQDCLMYVHQPLIYDSDSNLLSKIATTLNVSVQNFVTQRKTQLLDMFKDIAVLEKIHINTLATLLAANPSELLHDLINQVIDSLTKPALCHVTLREFEIMNTPDGEAYDQSVFQSAKAGAESNKNVKRESKAYSFKDQKIEMELREELRKKKGIAEKKVVLNKKQQEQLQIILAEEKSIRDRLTLMQEELMKITALLTVCMNANEENIKLYYVDLIKYLMQLFTSYLAAPHIVKIFIHLSQKLFQGDLKYLGEFVGNVILRLNDPSCDLPEGWQEEKLGDQVKRAINTLHTFVTEPNVYLLMTYTRKKPFSAPTFSYCLPLLKSVLQGGVKGSEEMRMKALQFIMAHSKLRSHKVDVIDEYGPELLPRREMLQILSEVIVTSEGHNKEAKLQQYANSVFDEVCKTASGQVGCAFATVEEIELLLGNILSSCSMLRMSSLKGLLDIVDVLPTEENELLKQLAKHVMIARFDLVEENADLAKSLWDQAGLAIKPPMIVDLLSTVTHPLDDIRLAASQALALSLEEIKGVDVLPQLLAMYENDLKIPPPVIDNLGRVVSKAFVDPWTSRQGVGLALEKIAQFVPPEKLEDLFRFFVPNSLGDRNEFVRAQMLDAAMQYVNHFGQDYMDLLLSIFQEFLDQAPDSSSQDTIRQSVIILTGSLAKHLAKTDPQVKPIFSKLMAALATPSQSVQQAVANCLPPLCSAVKDDAPKLIKTLMDQLLESESYGERRGAAFGLAGLVKGLGILSLKQQSIITTLNEAIQNKKVWRHREGALFAFETLCTMLGRLFEPYVVHLLPHLLLCFGDGNQYVREAADETAKAVMKNLSNHGVKLVLPSLLRALEEESWRTKTGSAELLGAMSFCAPKQLSSCLPSIVPKLTEVLADSHLKVQKAGQQALRQIGGVIRNPEIQEIAPIILDALSDPNNHTVVCLQALLSTSFVHFIDAPSLALIMPTLEKALGQRPTETKKMAAQILGNMYALTDPKDLSPYLPAVVPGLKKSLLDPSPEVRAVSARALGAIVKGMGEDCFNDLMPWLLETLTAEASSVDRSGAAQGLSEVLFALGPDRLARLMPDVIETTMKVDLAPNVRDGYLMLYIYLPATFEDQFLIYIGPIIPAILKGLADESEYVRDTSLKAGQRIINMYAESSIELLLPQLEAGLFNDHWRIRFSSVQLLGDLLFKLSGVTGKQTTVGEEDDNFGTAHSSQIILETLGAERRDHVYAGLYMGRSDVALAVRQAALHVWKVIVQNTAKTLREILPTLFELLLGALASQSYDKRQVAARTLGDLVRKLGERILPEIIPILEAGLDHEDSDKRQGVCIGLSEIMDSTSREMISQFEDSLITTIRRALVDPSADVRQAASLSFENLHNTIGHRALDGVLPEVFTKLDDPLLSEYALDGLKQVMAVKSKSVLPFLVPKLTTPPVNTKALAILSSVAGEALIKHIEKILPAMIQAVQSASNTVGYLESSEFDGTRTLILSVEDDTGMRTIIDELFAACKHKTPGIRKVAASLLGVFCKETRGDYSGYVQLLFRTIIQLMNDVDSDVVMAGWNALDALVKHLDPSEQLQHLSSLRQAVRFVKDDIRNEQLPGFCILKKGITPVLPIFREGILNGPQEVKEQAANGLGEIIKLTSAEALKPSVVHITGPLIRILGDRFSSSVKVAILDTLGLLLKKVGIMLKPFLPQLQTTFIKALNDSAFGVRQKAAWALGLLTVLHTRVDSLFTELKNGIRNNEDAGIKETILDALRTITLKAGAKMGEAIRNALLETLLELINSPADGIRVKAAAALGSLCQILPEPDIKELMTKTILDMNQTLDWTIVHGRAVTLSYALYDAPTQMFSTVDEDDIVDAVVKYSNNDRVPICTYGVHSLGHLLMYSKENADAAPTIVISSFKKNMVNSSMDIKLAALNTLKHVSRRTPEVLTFDRIRYIIPEFISLLKDRNTTVRSLSELTLAFVLQMDKNDIIFDECVNSISEVANILEEYRKNSFAKLSDSLATDTDNYMFVT